MNTYSNVSVLAPQSIGPIRSTFGRIAARLVLNRCSKIFVRESYSDNFARTSLQLREQPSLAGDMAFLFDRPNTEARTSASRTMLELGIEDNERVFGLTVVDWSFPGSANRGHKALEYRNFLKGISDFALSKGYRVLVLNQVSGDLGLAKDIQAELPHIIVDTTDRSPAEMQAMIERCDVFFGTRFHSCIFALLNTQPLGAIAYLPKTDGIMADLGLSEWVFKIDNLDTEAAIEHFNRLERDDGSLAKQAFEATQGYLKRIDGFVQYLHELALSR